MLAMWRCGVPPSTDAESRRKDRVLKASEKKTSHNPLSGPGKIKRDKRQNLEQRMLAPSLKLVQLRQSNVRLSMVVCKPKRDLSMSKQTRNKSKRHGVLQYRALFLVLGVGVLRQEAPWGSLDSHSS